MRIISCIIALLLVSTLPTGSSWAQTKTNSRSTQMDSSALSQDITQILTGIPPWDQPIPKEKLTNNIRCGFGLNIAGYAHGLNADRAQRDHQFDLAIAEYSLAIDECLQHRKPINKQALSSYCLKRAWLYIHNDQPVEAIQDLKMVDQDNKLKTVLLVQLKQYQDAKQSFMRARLDQDHGNPRETAASLYLIAIIDHHLGEIESARYHMMLAARAFSTIGLPKLAQNCLACSAILDGKKSKTPSLNQLKPADFNKTNVQNLVRAMLTRNDILDTDVIKQYADVSSDYERYAKIYPAWQLSQNRNTALGMVQYQNHRDRGKSLHVVIDPAICAIDKTFVIDLVKQYAATQYAPHHSVVYKIPAGYLEVMERSTALNFVSDLIVSEKNPMQESRR